MIAVANLKRMLHLELAAGGWFSRLSDEEKQAYIKAHPESKYAGGRAITGREKLAGTPEYHKKMQEYHEARALDLGRKGYHAKARRHDTAADAHSSAHNTAIRAAKTGASQYADEALRASNRAQRLSDKLRKADLQG